MTNTVAEAAPERLRKPVRRAGFLPRDGNSAYAPAQRDPTSLVGHF